MGSLSFAGALGGVGKGMQSNVEANRLTIREDLMRQHDIAIEGLRAKNSIALQEDQQKYSTEAAGIRSKHELGMAETRSSFEFGMQMNEQAMEVWKTNADNESDEWQTAFGQWSRHNSGEAGTNRKAASWDVEFIEVTDPENPMNISTRMLATHPNGTTVEQVEGRMIDASLTGKDRDKALGAWIDPSTGQPAPEKEQQAEMILLKELAKGNDTSEKFLDTFGYLPPSFYRAAFEKSDDAGMREFAAAFQRDRGVPINPYTGNMPRSTPDRTSGVPAKKSAGGALTEAANMTAPTAAQIAAPTATAPTAVTAPEESISEVLVRPGQKRPVSAAKSPPPAAAVDPDAPAWMNIKGQSLSALQKQGALKSAEFLRKQQAGQ